MNRCIAHSSRDVSRVLFSEVQSLNHHQLIQIKPYTHDRDVLVSIDESEVEHEGLRDLLRLNRLVGDKVRRLRAEGLGSLWEPESSPKDERNFFVSIVG